MNKFIKTVPISKIGYEFLRSLNGLLDLTDRELELLSVFLDIQLDSNKLKGGKNISIDSASNRKLVMSITSITKDNLSRYIKTFRRKQIFIKDEYSNRTYINKALIPIIIGNRVVQVTMILKVNNDEI